MSSFSESQVPSSPFGSVETLLQTEFDRLTDPDKSFWSEEPVSFEDFVTSSDFCHHPPLTPIQLTDVLAVLGEDPKHIYSQDKCSPYQIGVLEYGKGGGKDTIASLVQAYLSYVFLCMYEPAEYFRLGPGSTLDILNVAPVGQQAENIYFTYFSERIKRCSWFRDNFDLSVSGRLLDRRKNTSKGQINLGARSCIFPKGVRAFSLHSAHQSYEGYNVVFSIMDESCLAPKTKISTLEASTQCISTIVEEKKPVHVLSYNWNTQAFEYRPVVNWFKYPKKEKLFRIHLANGRSLECTCNHHIFVDDKRDEVRADELRVGDKLYTKHQRLSSDQNVPECMQYKCTQLAKALPIDDSGEPEAIEIVSIEQFDYEGFVYDIEVEGNHNYVADGIIVHNSAFTSDGKRANGPDVLNLLRSSATSRFGNAWKGFLLSFPRYPDDIDFTTIQLNKCGNLGGPNPTMYGSRHPTWEVAPTNRFTGGTFTFDRVLEGKHVKFDNVPVMFKPEFDSDPYEALAKYGTIVLRSKHRWLSDLTTLGHIMGPRHPIFETQTIIVQDNPDNEAGVSLYRGIGKEIVSWDISIPNRRLPFVIHIDLGLKQDSAALMIGHGEPTMVQVNVLDADGTPRVDAVTGEFVSQEESILKVIEDAHIVWKPEPETPVSTHNVERIVLEICQELRVVYVSMDFWNSARLVESLKRRGIPTEQHNIDRYDYNNLRRSLSAGYVDLLQSTLLWDELTNLEDDGQRVDHPVKGSKDLADCLAGIHRVLNHNKADIIKRLKQPGLLVRAGAGFNHRSPTGGGSNSFVQNLPFNYGNSSPSGTADSSQRNKTRSIRGVSLTKSNAARGGSNAAISRRFG